MARSKKTKASEVKEQSVSTEAAKEDLSEGNLTESLEAEAVPEKSEDAIVLEDPVSTPEDSGANAPDDPIETSEINAPIQPDMERPSVFLPVLIGGLAAGAIGFGAATYFDAQKIAAGPSPEQLAMQVTLAAQTEELAAQSSVIADLTAQIAELNVRSEAINAAQDDALSAIVERIDNLPSPAAVLPNEDGTILNEEVAAALATQKDQIASLSSELEEMTAFAKSQMEAAASEVENVVAREKRAQANAAVSTIRATLETGAPFADVLPDIAAVIEVPATLRDVAQSGVTTLNALQASFGPAARDALSAARREQAGDGTADRVKLFFQDQLGTRSLVPREGDDPDAVLSRIESAVKAGDLTAVAPLVALLPESGQAALASWVDRVETRHTVVAAVQTLSDALAAK